MSFRVIDLGEHSGITYDEPSHHVYVVDVSGSMYRDLPNIREHLKNVASLVVKPEDTMSLIWFSGKDQFGQVFSNISLDGIMNLQAVHNSIDKFIKPVGLTCFWQALNLAMTLVKTKEDGSPLRNNLIMLTDGYDNVSKRSDLINTAATLPSIFDNIAFIEYGYYADRELLVGMAQKAGGVHIFADGFTDYADAMVGQLNLDAAPPKTIEVPKDTKHVVFSYCGDIRITEAKDGRAKVPEDVTSVYVTSDADVDINQLNEHEMYLFAYYGLTTGALHYTTDCLWALGDIELIDLLDRSFTKQELSILAAQIKECYFDPTARFKKGKDANYDGGVAKTSILDLLSYIDSCDEVYLDINSPSFKYNRIGASHEVDEDSESGQVKEQAKVGSMPKITGIVTNTERPNISIRVVEEIILRPPENEWGITSIPSHRTRNYTVIRDGIKNISTLPIAVSRGVYDDLTRFLEGGEDFTLIDESGEFVQIEIHLDKLPVVSRGMVQVRSFSTLAHTYIQGLERKAIIKVMKHLMPAGERKAMAGLVGKYGQEAANWLDSIGIRDYGYSPVGTTTVRTGDVYVATELNIKAKGLSSLPSVNSVEKKISAGKKLNAADQLIANALVKLGTKPVKKELIAIEEKIARSCDNVVAAEVFAAILSRKGFDDCTTDTPDVYECDVDGTLVTGTIRNIEIKI